MKPYLLIGVAGLLLAAVACQKEKTAVTDNAVEQETVAGEELVELTFSAEIEENKATLDGTTVKWALTDHVGIYDGHLLRDFSVVKIENNVAWLRGQVRAGTDPATFYAVYPYSAAAQALPSGDAIRIVYPNVQQLTSASTNSIAPEGMVAIAKATGVHTTLNFKQVSSLLKIKIPDSGIKSVTLIGNNNEVLGGEMTCVPGSAPNVSAAGSAVKSITLLPSSSTFTSGREYYIALPPTSFTQGFTLRFRKDSQYSDANLGAAVTFARKSNKSYSNTLSIYPFSWTSAPSLNITNQSTLQNFINSNLAGDIGTLANDITLTSWTPNVLRGHLNGNGKTISSLSVSKASPACFITTLEPGAKLSNVTISGSITLNGSAASSQAGVVGNAKGIIDGVTSNVTVSSAASFASSAYVGGLVGLLSNGGTIVNSHNRGAVSLNGATAFSFIGGVVGYMANTSGPVVSCDNSATISCSTAYGQGFGGIAGMAQGGGIYSSTNTGGFSISNCSAGNSYIGGIVGFAQNQSSKTLAISSCVNDAAISPSASARALLGIGGIVGIVHEYANASYAVSDCENKKAVTMNTGSTDVAKGGVGGIIGCWRSWGSVDWNVNRGAVSLTHNSQYNGVGGIIGLVRNRIYGDSELHSLTLTTSQPLTLHNNYNFGTISLAWYDGCTGSDLGGTGGVIGYIYVSDAVITMTKDRSVGNLNAAARAGCVFGVSEYSNSGLSISLTDCKIGGTFTGFARSSRQTNVAITGSNYNNYIYSYYNTGGGVTVTQSDSGYISADQAETELVYRYR